MKSVSSIFILVLGLVSLSTSTLTASETATFKKANNTLADRETQDALSEYFNIVDTSGTSYPLAKNIAKAAEQANEVGVLEWANSSAQLRALEWVLMAAAVILIVWACSLAWGIWKRWSLKRHLLTFFLAGISIATCLYSYNRWAPPENDAVIIHPSTAPDGKFLTSTNIFISPFNTAEVVGSLTLGTHVRIDPGKSTSDFVYVSDPHSELSGWLPTPLVRPVGK